MPVVNMADILGWETTVVDGRANYAKKERFVSACQVLVSKPEQVLEQIAIDEQTVFLLMTHNYNYDMAMLRQLLQKNVTYIGMLGPKKKRERMLNELKDEGLSFYRATTYPCFIVLLVWISALKLLKKLLYLFWQK